ncbi:MAG: hypothetical protein ACXVRZ_11555 [Gaiellaceae bacterium]
MLPVRTAVVSLLVFALLPLSATAGSAPVPPASLTVESVGSNFSIEAQELDISLDLTGETGALGKLALVAPRHYPVLPDRLPGAPVGAVYAWIKTAGGDLDLFTGHIDAEAVGAEPAGDCAHPGYTGIWELRLRAGLRSLSMPLFLYAPRGGKGAVEFDLCPPSTGPRIVALILRLNGLEPPWTPAHFLWRALVTPLGAGGALRPDREYEVRALVPVPHVLTLRSTLDTAGHNVRLAGTLRVDRHAEARAAVIVTKLDRAITPHGIVFRDAPMAGAVTDSAGRYSTRVHVSRTLGFVAATVPTTTPCGHVASAPPRGCISVTRSGVESEPLTVSVP